MSFIELLLSLLTGLMEFFNKVLFKTDLKKKNDLINEVNTAVGKAKSGDTKSLEDIANR